VITYDDIARGLRCNKRELLPLLDWFDDRAVDELDIW
tara:strand:- start:194 stop:304 length:111 start_codon:yes stop_codon:yes gene_type:complete